MGIMVLPLTLLEEDQFDQRMLRISNNCDILETCYSITNGSKQLKFKTFLFKF